MNFTNRLLTELNQRFEAATKEEKPECIASQLRVLADYEHAMSTKILIVLREAGASQELALHLSQMIAELMEIHDHIVARLIMQKSISEILKEESNE